MPETVQLILSLIAAFPQDLAAVETFFTSVSSLWSQTDKDAVQQALDAAKAQDDADTAALNQT